MGWKTMHLLRAVSVCLAASGGIACGSAGEGPQKSESSAPLIGNAPPEITVEGRRFVRVGAAPVSVGTEPPTASGIEAVEGEQQLPTTVDELAESLRGVVLVDGHEYREATPNRELAELILSGRLQLEHPKTLSSPGAAASTADSEDPAGGRIGRRVIGTDDRQYVAGNQFWPLRTFVFGDQGCTGTMVGRGTMVTAAHCVYKYGVGWIAVDDPPRWPRYAPGVDGRDQNPTPYGWYGCYTPIIPYAWTTHGTLVYDFAVVDFYTACGSRPGDTVGWLGTNIATDSEIYGEQHYLYGYPFEAGGAQRYPTEEPPYTDAEIWGHSMATYYTWADPDIWYQLNYWFDTSPGQSGSAVWYSEDGTGYYYLDGIHKSGDPQDQYNRARRWTADVRAFVAAHSPDF